MDPITRMLYDLRARADADPYYNDIELIVLRPRYNDDGTVAENASFATLQQRVDEAINCQRLKAGRGGAAVSFLMPQGDTTRPNISGPQMEFTYTARVQEHPILNFGPHGTRKSAEEIALHTLQLFHLCMLNGANCLGADPATLTPSDQFAPKLTYDVRLRAQGGLAAPVKCALPIISPRSGAAPLEVTLTCGTSGAKLYYTTNESYPSSRNLAATLYGAPFTLAAAATLRVAAEKTGLQQSDVAQCVFS
jgi:hypothetical protein